MARASVILIFNTAVGNCMGVLPNLSHSRHNGSMLQQASADQIQVRSEGDWNWTFLTRYLPYSLAARELMRLQALSAIGALQKPILDVGCGDGLFWESIIRSNQKLGANELSGLLGLDVSTHELNLASVRLNEHGGQVLSADICSTTPLGQSHTEKQFRTVIANCSLEHVSSIEAALRNIHSLMDERGRFLLFVPVPRWTDTLRLKRVCDRVSRRLGGLVAGCLDGFFQHNHLYPAEVWRFLLGGIGFDVIDIVGVGSSSANSVFERYLPTALLSFIFKLLFRRYPTARLSLGRSRRVEEFLQDVNAGGVVSRNLDNPNLVEYFILCQKRPITSSITK